MVNIMLNINPLNGNIQCTNIQTNKCRVHHFVAHLSLLLATKWSNQLSVRKFEIIMCTYVCKYIHSCM